MERAKRERDLGNLSGKILVFGGVYSNLQALRKMQTIADELAIPASHILCTGDVVGYCAEPEECIRAIMDWGIPTIAGNVELQLGEGQEDCGCNFESGSRCNLFSRQWYPYAQSHLSQTSINWMLDLPDFIRFRVGDFRGLVVHGSLHETAEFIFASTPWSVKEKNFVDGRAEVILAGHCGLPFAQQQANRYWLNAGVIGMPANDGTNRVWYMILEVDQDGHLNYQHHSFEYDFLKAADLMEEQNLPIQYAQTLRTGIWDNCEILPDLETEKQGEKIDFT